MKPTEDSTHAPVEKIIRRRSLIGMVAIAAACIGTPISICTGTDANGAPADETIETDQPLSEYDRLNQEAAELIVASDWVPAFKKLKQAFELDPGRPEVYLLYARAHFLREEYPAAERAFRKELEIDPSLPEVWYEFAKLMLLKGDLNEALTSIRKAITLSDGKQSDYLVLLGELYAEMGLRESAEKAFDDAIAILQDTLTRCNHVMTNYSTEMEVVNVFHEIESSFDLTTGELIETPITRYQTQSKSPPPEWIEQVALLKDNLETVKARKIEVLAWMDTARTDSPDAQPGSS